jgi:type IV pilus assembly protein PilV
LVETLIAVLVLGVGLLGLANLQVVSVRQTHNAYLRSQATLLAQDMADRMRANLAGVSNGRAGYDNCYWRIRGAGAQERDPGFDCSTRFPSGGLCTPAQMAAADVYLWNRALGAALPSGRGDVDCVDAVAGDGDDCSLGSMHTITVYWTEAEGGIRPTNTQTPVPNFQFTTTFQP